MHYSIDLYDAKFPFCFPTRTFTNLQPGLTISDIIIMDYIFINGPMFFFSHDLVTGRLVGDGIEFISRNIVSLMKFFQSFVIF